ncbi:MULTISPECIES: hypothetical protein [unclassified Microcoleus]|uniref:hypothetical protein n=1 Tax=unclassified Microcoleus TaxID=2642155 RepID=UPI002FD24D3D
MAPFAIAIPNTSKLPFSRSLFNSVRDLLVYSPIAREETGCDASWLGDRQFVV